LDDAVGTPLRVLYNIWKKTDVFSIQHIVAHAGIPAAGAWLDRSGKDLPYKMQPKSMGERSYPVSEPNRDSSPIFMV